MFLLSPTAPSQKPMALFANKSNTVLYFHKGVVRADTFQVVSHAGLHELKSGAAANQTPSMHARPAYSDPSWILMELAQKLVSEAYHMQCWTGTHCRTFVQSLRELIWRMSPIASEMKTALSCAASPVPASVRLLS